MAADRPAAPKRWRLVDVRVPEGEARDLALVALIGAGVGAVEELPDSIRTAFADTPDGLADLDRAREALAGVLAAAPAGSTTVDERWVAHEAWEESWRHGLAPRAVSRRIVVRPSWTDPIPLNAGVRELILDPGVAFGTAEHATTRGALRLLDAAIRPGDRLADLGSGSGILAIAGALLGASEVVAVDFDPFATGAALENVERNGVEALVRVVEADLTAGSVAALGPREGILANIRTGILLSLLPGIVAALVPGGWVVLSGILRPEAPEIRVAAAGLGLDLDDVDEEEGWWSVRFRRLPAGPHAATGGAASDMSS